MCRSRCAAEVAAHSCEQDDQQQAVLGTGQQVYAPDNRIQPSHSKVLVALCILLLKAGGAITISRACQSVLPSIDVDYQHVQVVVIFVARWQSGPTGCADTCAEVLPGLRLSATLMFKAKVACDVHAKQSIRHACHAPVLPSPRRAAMSATKASGAGRPHTYAPLISLQRRPAFLPRARASRHVLVMPAAMPMYLEATLELSCQESG